MSEAHDTRPRWDIYYRDREYAREQGDPRLTTVQAETKDQAEQIAAEAGHGGYGGTWAVPVGPPTCGHLHNPSPSGAGRGA
jgi:hypothetical protein